jgi:hypothetical protein
MTKDLQYSGLDGAFLTHCRPTRPRARAALGFWRVRPIPEEVCFGLSGARLDR